MGEKIVIGPINQGLRNDVRPFNIDNDSFPTLLNAYQWRSRVKRKRGTSLATRLTRFFDSTNASYNSGATTFVLGGGNGNLLSNASWMLQADGNIVPGSVTITVGANVYTDPSENGTLTGPNPGTINYATGAISIPAEAGNAASAVFLYYPDLPVMGLDPFVLREAQFPLQMAFDTVYSYIIVNNAILGPIPYPSYDVSFFKNPPTGTYPAYVEKTVVTPVTWNGQDYQQFWTVNYEGALWATNGINIPFETTNIGMQFVEITTIAIGAGGPPAIVTITTSAPHGLSIGDFVFINEVVGLTGINLQTGYVTAVPAANQITVEFPDATIAGAYVSGGIVQYLTNRIDPTLDCIRWFDGDPTDGNVTTPALTGHKGWVNFCPPLSLSPFIVSDLPEAQYYLVGARMIVPFKDRLLFLGPVVQTSSAGSQRYLPDTIIYSQNGTPYYTASFTGDPSLATTVFTPILLPDNQTSSPMTFIEDQTGFGGSIQAGVSEDIITASTNEDALILGFTNSQTRLVYTGTDIIPFNFYVINSEYGSASTFSYINMDRAVLSVGSRGIIATSQTEASRIDLPIPDEVFQFQLTNNGFERVTAQRDFIQEWIYFTYPYQGLGYKFPTQTLQYNYRDNSWAVFRESYTTYGIFKSQTGFTWQTVGFVFPSWNDWDEAWNAGSSDALQPQVIGGNQQGFVLIRDDGTTEGVSLYIQSIVGDVITSPNHCLNTGDYIVIHGAIGTNVSAINGHTFSIRVIDDDSFQIDPGPAFPVTYVGGGTIERIYVPLIQTKQFPVAWNLARKTRIGPQQYLLSSTANAQITLLIYLSQNSSSSYNRGPLVPAANVQNNSLIFSTVLYTCPESTNLGLTPANTNLNLITAPEQEEIWHRINTSLLGDTVQLGFTLSAEQLDTTVAADTLTITGATQANPCVLTCNNTLSVGGLIEITGVVGMTELNSIPTQRKIYEIAAVSPTTITIAIDSTAFGAYTSGGIATPLAYVNDTAEIELHSIILDVNPSQLLA